MSLATCELPHRRIAEGEVLDVPGPLDCGPSDSAKLLSCANTCEMNDARQDANF